MSYIEFISVAIAAIFTIIAILKQPFPWLGNGGSKYIPLITLACGIGIAVYCHYHYHINGIEAFLTAILPAIGSSGVNSFKNTIRNNYL